MIGIINLGYQIYSLIANKNISEIEKEWKGNTSYGELKKSVANSLSDFLSELQKKYTEVDDSELLSKLKESEKAMNISANKTLLKVQKAVGLR